MKSQSIETPAQKIKRLKKESSNEKIKTKILNTMIDLSDQQYGTSIRKKFYPSNHLPKKKIKPFIMLSMVWDKQTSYLPK
jgi:hypothetical protein